MDWTSYLFSFNGRVNRAKWWLYFLIAIGYAIAAGIIGVLFAQIDGTLAMIWGIIALIGYLVLFYVYFAIGAKRLHDRNKTAWWLLVFYVLPWVLACYAFGSFIMGMLGAGALTASGAPPEAAMGSIISSMQQMWWVSLIMTIIGVWGLVELGCLKGTTGDNQYGPDPLPAGHP